MSVLERAIDEALGSCVAACSTCKGPSSKANNLVSLGPRELLGVCAECGEPVHPDGRTARRLIGGGGMMPVIVLREDT